MEAILIILDDDETFLLLRFTNHNNPSLHNPNLYNPLSICSPKEKDLNFN